MNQTLYDASLAFDERPQSVGFNVWLTVAVGAGRDLIALTAHALREFQERDFCRQFGAVGMRYISPLYNEEFLIRELAQMRLTGDTRVLEKRHDRRGLATAAASNMAS